MVGLCASSTVCPPPWVRRSDPMVTDRSDAGTGGPGAVNGRPLAGSPPQSGAETGSCPRDQQPALRRRWLSQSRHLRTRDSTGHVHLELTVTASGAECGIFREKLPPCYAGRYGPRNEQQLADAVTVFEDYGYEVSSLGWEDGMPTAYLP